MLPYRPSNYLVTTKPENGGAKDYTVRGEALEFWSDPGWLGPASVSLSLYIVDGKQEEENDRSHRAGKQAKEHWMTRGFSYLLQNDESDVALEVWPSLCVSILSFVHGNHQPTVHKSGCRH